MHNYTTSNKIFDKCKIDGMFVLQHEINLESIKSMIRIADGSIESANRIKQDISKESNEWNSVYKLYYDALHGLIEAFLYFDRIKSNNHQCLFAFLCENHKYLELSWDFFEKIRTKRNGINYYGKPVNYEDWKEIEIQINLYIKTLKSEIEKKIKEALKWD